MVNQDILGALKSAISRGQTIQQAMQTLYNAGYPLQEIQEAAGALQPQPIQQESVEQEQIKNIQQQKKPMNKILILILIIFLIILLGSLIAVFIFKEQIIEILVG